MIPDAKILLVMAESFDALNIDMTVEMNHRLILDGVFVVARFPTVEVRFIISVVESG